MKKNMIMLAAIAATCINIGAAEARDQIQIVGSYSLQSTCCRINWFWWRHEIVFVKEITEMVVGYDGIAIAQSKKTAAFDLSKHDMMLAVAAEVPSKDGSHLVANPYHFWNEINPKLPHRAIRVYGPPASSGTRDAFEDMILKHLTKHIDTYTKLYKADKKKNT